MINPFPASISPCDSFPSGVVRRAVSRNPNALRSHSKAAIPSSYEIMGMTAGVLVTRAVLLMEVRRLRVIAAFLPAARRFRVVAAFIAAVRRFRVTAAFRAADVTIVNSFGLTNPLVWLTQCRSAPPPSSTTTGKLRAVTVV